MFIFVSFKLMLLGYKVYKIHSTQLLQLTGFVQSAGSCCHDTLYDQVFGKLLMTAICSAEKLGPSIIGFRPILMANDLP